MPRFADLDAEQRRVYQGAPPDGSVLVVGPPGTGKTVMAFHRATYLKKAGQSPRVIMFNSVLSEYVSANNRHAEGIGISTMHKWVTQWFKELGLRSPPLVKPYVFDWPAVASAVQPAVANGKASKANWGHLVVDEGQDFPREMYTCLALLLGMQARAKVPPALTVFADENQRLWANNSSIDDIRRALALTGENRVFSLTKNYRNTKQVAAFASHYYCGLRTGKAELPDREGPKPVVSLHRGQKRMVEAIIGFIEETRDLGLEIGVICPREKTRFFIHQSLLEAYEGDDELTIQSFKSGDRELTARNLNFDKGSVVTVLCRESVKGLEFDAALVIDPFLRADAEGSGEQQFKMNMYVACSRAREHLRLLFVSERAKVMGVLPPASRRLYDLVED